MWLYILLPKSVNGYLLIEPSTLVDWCYLNIKCSPCSIILSHFQIFINYSKHVQCLICFLSTRHTLIYIMPTTTLWIRHCYCHPHFTVEETEAQRGWVTCPRSQSYSAAEPREGPLNHYAMLLSTAQYRRVPLVCFSVPLGLRSHLGVRECMGENPGEGTNMVPESVHQKTGGPTGCERFSGWAAILLSSVKCFLQLWAISCQ